MPPSTAQRLAQTLRNRSFLYAQKGNVCETRQYYRTFHQRVLWHWTSCCKPVHSHYPKPRGCLQAAGQHRELLQHAARMGGAAGVTEGAWLDAVTAPSHNRAMHGGYRMGAAPMEQWGLPLESLLPGSRGGGSLHSSGRDAPGAALQRAMYGAAVGASAAPPLGALQLGGAAGGDLNVRPGRPTVGTLMGPALGSLQLGSGGRHGSSEPLQGLGPGLGLGLGLAPEVALPRLHSGGSSHAGDAMPRRGSGGPMEQHPEARNGESCRPSPLVRGHCKEQPRQIEKSRVFALIVLTALKPQPIHPPDMRACCPGPVVATETFKHLRPISLHGILRLEMFISSAYYIVCHAGPRSGGQPLGRRLCGCEEAQGHPSRRAHHHP